MMQPRNTVCLQFWCDVIKVSLTDNRNSVCCDAWCVWELLSHESAVGT